MRVRRTPAPNIDRRAYTLSEAAQALCLGTNTVRGLIKSGRLHAVMAGARIIVPAAAIERFLAEDSEQIEGAPR